MPGNDVEGSGDLDQLGAVGANDYDRALEPCGHVVELLDPLVWGRDQDARLSRSAADTTVARPMHSSDAIVAHEVRRAA